MTVPPWLAWAGQIPDVVQAYGQHIAVGAGAIGVLIALRALRRLTKGKEHDDLAATLGVLLFGVVTTEGMWEVVHNKLGVNIGLTIAMFAAFDVVIYSQGRLAIRKLTANPKARVGTYLGIIWGLSIAASLTVSTAGGNVTTQLFRFFSPLVAAALWTQKVAELRNGKAERVESNWIWTPSRLMVRWGWLKPGAADDLSQVFAQRRIAALVDAALELDAARDRGTQPTKPSRWRRQRDPLADAQRRVRRLTKAASREDLEAAREQLHLVLTAEQRLFRRDDRLDEAGRQTLDDVRLIMRQATDQVRAGHARAFASAREPLVELGGIRMPAHIAARIGSLPAHRPGHEPGHSGGDLETTQPATADPVREPAIGSPVIAAEVHGAAHRRVTERVTKPVTPESAKRLRQAHTKLTRRHRREPTNPELAEATGLSPSTVKRWKATQK